MADTNRKKNQKKKAIEAARTISKRKFGLLEVFAGLGSVARGFEATDRFQTLLLNDIDSSASEAYVARYGEQTPYVCKDVRYLTVRDIKKHAGDGTIDGLLGCPPCQGFSEAGLRDSDDPRNKLISNYFSLIRRLKPKFFVMENVRGLLSYELFQSLLKEIERNYVIWTGVLNAALYGVPQTRKRAIAIGYHRDLGVVPTGPLPTHFGSQPFFDYCTQRLVEPTTTAGWSALGLRDTESHEREWDTTVADFLRTKGARLKNLITLEEAIGDLPTAQDFEEPLLYVGTATRYSRELRADAVFNHAPWQHTSRTVRRLRNVREGRGLYDESGKGRSKQYYSQAYSRLHRKGLARTITTNFHNPGSGRYLHYRETRTLTVREAARVQGIEDAFVFNLDSSVSERLIGNAFPRPLAEAIGRHILSEIARKL